MMPTQPPRHLPFFSVKYREQTELCCVLSQAFVLNRVYLISMVLARSTALLPDEDGFGLREMKMG